MSTTDFWTIGLDMSGHPGETVTLCESCALDSTNAAAAASDFVDKPFQTMTEAALMLDMVMAMAGFGGSGITSSRHGSCDACKAAA